MRAELSPSEEASHLKRRKEIWAELGALGGASCPTKPQHQKKFAAETSSRTGVDKRTVNRAIHRAEALGDDISRIKGTSLD